MKLFAVLFAVLSLSCRAQKLSPEDDIVRRWISEGKAPAAAAFLDAAILISDNRLPEDKIRLFLLNAVAQAESGSFNTAYRRVRQAEDLLEWTGFKDRLTYDEKARNRIRSSIDLVLHDVREAEGKFHDEALR
ncbi:MAG: hypothetical protein ABIR96_02305 [Bdellovibrionota bacterium]